MSLVRKKTIEQSIADTDEPEYQLKKRLTAIDLTVFGIGVIIGAGIFTLTGKAAAQYAGPSIALSFVLAAICCGLAALCYAEFSSTVPVSGSAYTFSYFSLGEIFAWIIGWDLLLELMLGASVVAQGWSEYAALFLNQIGLGWPSSIGPGSSVNILAMLLVLVLGTLATIGIKESLRVNLVLVAIKLFVVLFVIVAGLFYIKGSNLSPFVPASVPSPGGKVELTTPLIQAVLGFTPSTFGVAGLVSGAALVFFAFIGFDVVATTAEEAKNPQRDLPRGIIGSLVICTVLYVLVCIVITGMVKYNEIDPKAALAEAFKSVGKGGFATLISAGAVAGLTTVVLTLMIGAARVVFAMSRDHLLPRQLGKTHPKWGTPYRLTISIGIVVAIVAGVTPIGKLEEMVNIGTLAAFTLVSIAVPLLRKSRPDIKRSFTVPLNPVIPIIAALICVYLMVNLSLETWIRFLIWMALGFAIYFLYGHKKSRVGLEEKTGEVQKA
ncbi:amino acid permease [Kribbella hippodromi]|uniref:Amino acid permease n=1 Tax=Kribbella hippodromi TaxID=434347 RepID=A0ABN2DD69_9ACTN